MLRTLSLGLVLFVLWTLLSGFFQPFFIWLGVASCVLGVLIARRMNLIDREGHPIQLILRGFTYWPWLFWEILKANVDIARAILHLKKTVRPQVLHFKGSQKSELGHVIYGNSITLTPGTVTIGLEKGLFEVHVLTDGAAKDLQSGNMDRRVTVLEGLSSAPKKEA